MSTNSFDAKATLSVGGRELRDLPARRAAGEVRRRAAAVLAEDPAREPAAQRGRRDRRRRRTSRRSRRWDAKAEPSKEIAFTPGARAAAGLHRRARRRRPRRDARRDGDARRRPGEDQPARAGRARDRPLGAGRRVRHAPTRFDAQRRAASSSATRSATRSCAGARTRSRTSRSCRPDTGIVHQVNLEYLARVVFVDDDDGGPRLSRHARRHRLAHDDGQRPRRARLGRRRHRGRGRDARPADLDADPAGGRLQARRASCPRARPRPTSC